MRILLMLLAMITLSAFTPENKTAYHWFDADGNNSDYKSLFEKIADADVILFGELHNNSIVHWYQLELLKDLYQLHKSAFTLALEQLEADNQIILEEYFNGFIATRHFEREARLWPNYRTDIKPLVEFCLANDIHVIASNIPRRYAAMVALHGLEKLKELSEQAKSYIAPLPVKVDLELPAYKRMMEGMAHGHGQMEPENFVHAQAIKDATMAHFIAKRFKKNNQPVLHINGAYHSNHYEGIYWYLNKVNPDLNIVTISTTESADPNTWKKDWTGLADFILVVNENMTKTH